MSSIRKGKERRGLLAGRPAAKRSFANLITDEEHICKLAKFILEMGRFRKSVEEVESSGS